MLSDWLIGPGLRRMVWVLLGAVAVLMVLSCANIASLLITRAAGRQGEMGVRVALGAEPTRLIRQLMTESVLLAVIGGGLGILIAYWALDGLSALLANLLPLGRSAHVRRPRPRVHGRRRPLSAVGFGLTPALHAASADLQTALRPAGRGTTPGGRKWADALVGIQVALAMLLLVASLLLMGSFARLSRVNVGFDVANVLTVPLDLPRASVSRGQAAGVLSRRARQARQPPGRRVCRGDSDQSVQAVGLCQRRDARGSGGGCAAKRLHASWVAQRDAGVLPVAARADAERPHLHRGRSRWCAWSRHRLAESGEQVVADEQRARSARVLGRRRGTDSNRRRRGRRHSRREARCRSDADALSAVRAAADEGHDAARQDARNCGRYARRGSTRDSGP